MTDTPENPADVLTTLASLAGEFAEATEAATRGLLAAEQKMLQALVTPAAPAVDEAARQEAERRAEAETEAGFDNMPV